MRLQGKPNRSLYGVLGGIIVIVVVLVLGSGAIINYQMQREQMMQEMKQQSELSMATLQKNLAGFIESYAINEYQRLVATEIMLRHHFAIIVTDFNMGGLLSQAAYVSGKIQDPSGNLVDYDPDDERHRKWLKSAFYTSSATIAGQAGNELGSVSIYISDRAMQRELNQILVQTFYNTAVILFLLIALLLLSIRQLLIRPLYKLRKVLSRHDADGTPTSPIPPMRFREIGVLTDTINTMLEVIRDSRNTLQDERNRLSNVITATQVGTWEWKVDTGEVVFNERWAEIVGYTLEELQPTSINTWMTLTHPDDLKKSDMLLQRHFSGETPDYECEARMRHKDGHWVWILDRGRLISRSKSGEPLIMSGTHLDITLRKHAEEKLRQSASVFEHANEGIMITDPDGTILDVNDAFMEISGYTRDEVIGADPSMLKSGRQNEEFYKAAWDRLKQQGQWSGEIWNERKNGEEFAARITISSVQDDAGITGYVVLFTDITAIKEYQDRLEKIAHFDVLTGLPNRSLLDDRLRKDMAHAKRKQSLLGLIYLDLDGFKSVNDSYGHDTGDKLLRIIADRMREALRESDTLARIGGDEFIAVLTDLESHQASGHILERLHDAASSPVYLMDRELRVTASIGVTFYPQHELVDADQLIRQADQAMYMAKQAGKNRYHVFDAVQDQAVRGHFEKLDRVREAMEKEEFVLYYQPKVNLRTGSVLGVEALIRWNHPEQGLLRPDSFLPVIASDQLMIQVGDWVLEEAASQAESWRRNGLMIPVSVNIDGLQFIQDDFVDKLHACLARHPTLGPGDLELEVLESSALEDINRVNQLITECEKIGIGFSLDDFGTGYSSLTYLKRLPAKFLKIDQSFVRDMLEDPEDLAILEGVLGLADAFQRKAIAEGVETVEHGSMLLSLGCDLAQGYGIAKPMRAENIPNWIKTWKPDQAWARRPRVGGDELPVLFSTVEHRAWVLKLERYLQDKLFEPPTLDPRACFFGQWLDSQGAKKYTHLKKMLDIRTIHDLVHKEAEAIIRLKQQGKADMAYERLQAILHLRDELILLMEQLILKEV